MIHIKDGGTSSHKKLFALDPKPGDTFLSADGTVIVFIKPSGWVSYVRTDSKDPVLGDSTLSSVSEHHTFKRVEVDLIVRAV